MCFMEYITDASCLRNGTHVLPYLLVLLAVAGLISIGPRPCSILCLTTTTTVIITCVTSAAQPVLLSLRLTWSPGAV